MSAVQPLNKKRIVIADDFPEMIEEVERRLAPHYEIVGKVHDGLALIECVCRLRPHVLITDISMPHLTGIEVLNRLRDLQIKVAAVILTMHADEELRDAAFAAGARGYVVKSRLETELRLAVSEVLAGRTFLSEPVFGMSAKSTRAKTNSV
jgi:DNA-binding NarL/FixJ family response regulator